MHWSEKFTYDTLKTAFEQAQFSGNAAEFSPYIDNLLKKNKDNLQSVLKITGVLQEIEQSLIVTWLPRTHIYALLKIGIKRDLLYRLKQILVDTNWYTRVIKEIVTTNAKMQEDSYGFYIQNKGNKRFPRFGSLSLGYSRASLSGLLNNIIKTAVKYKNTYNSMYDYYRNDFMQAGEKLTQQEAKERALGDAHSFCIHNGWESQVNDFGDFSHLKNALEQDIRSTWLPQEILNELSEALHIQKLWKLPSRGEGSSQQWFLEAFFCYFSGIDDVKAYVDRRQTGNAEKQALIEDFIRAYHNNPRINTRLIWMSPGDLWTKNFEKKLTEWENYEYKGGIKRKDIIDTDGTRFPDQYY